MSVIKVIASTRIDHGGTSRSVPALCTALSNCGVHVQLVTGRTRGVQSILPDNSVPVHFVEESAYFGRLLNAGPFSQLITSLHARAPSPCLVHDHGIWLPSNRAVARSAKKKDWIRVVSPRGMVSEWALEHGSRKKRIAWSLYQKRHLESATAFHATSELEADELRRLGMRQPIAVIPNGVQPPASKPNRDRRDGKNRMLFLSRIHPKKGLLNLISAWQQVNPQDWELLLVGPDEAGYRGEVERQITALGLSSEISFHPEVNELEKWQQYANADIFILPSFSENFGIVVAEALVSGLPVITTTGTPWSTLAHDEVGWCVEPTVEGLSDAIQKACSLNEKARLEMSQHTAQWAANRFEWPAIAEQMSRFYQWLISRRAQPESPCDFIRL
ncbi:glycosyltransferase [Allorhodopirellula heiligendammensis]|uniref:glycosyltransferase n=1 Tax=Allorhodopirellula heiligendammensis TaxID=2714739 RepID=UPI00345EBF53